MCKSCDGWGEYLTKKDFNRGKVEVSDFDEETRYRHAKRRKKKEKVKTRPGCIGNDYGPHVFVWTQELERKNTLFYKFYGFHKYHREVCAGCSKTRKVEHSERYTKRNERAWNRLSTPPKGEPVSRWARGKIRPSYFSFEQYDDEFVAYKREFIAKHGYLYTALDGRFLW